jgi:hypothetical protein
VPSGSDLGSRPVSRSNSFHRSESSTNYASDSKGDEVASSDEDGAGLRGDASASEAEKRALPSETKRERESEENYQPPPAENELVQSTGPLEKEEEKGMEQEEVGSEAPHTAVESIQDEQAGLSGGLTSDIANGILVNGNEAEVADANGKKPADSGAADPNMLQVTPAIAGDGVNETLQAAPSETQSQKTQPEVDEVSLCEECAGSMMYLFCMLM